MTSMDVVYQRLEDSNSVAAVIANAKEWAQSEEVQSSHPYQCEVEEWEPPPEQLRLLVPLVTLAVDLTIMGPAHLYVNLSSSVHSSRRWSQTLC